LILMWDLTEYEFETAWKVLLPNVNPELWEVWEHTVSEFGCDHLYGEEHSELLKDSGYLQAVVDEDKALRENTADLDEPLLIERIDRLNLHEDYPFPEALRMLCLADPFWRVAARWGEVHAKEHVKRIYSFIVLGRLRHLMVNAILGPYPELLDDWNADLLKRSGGGAALRIDKGCTPRSFVESVQRYKRIRTEGPEVDDPELLAEIQPLLDEDPEYAAERAAALGNAGFGTSALRTRADLDGLRRTLEIRRREQRRAKDPFSSEALEWHLNRIEDGEGMN
jgi:hypothetical protein